MSAYNITCDVLYFSSVVSFTLIVMCYVLEDAVGE